MTTITTETVSLADRIAGAEAAAIPARERVGELQAALTHAVSVGEYEQAADVKTQLAEARDALAVADAAVTALREGAAQVERQRAEDDRMIAAARQRDQAERDLEAARQDEVRRLGQVDEALSRMWAAVAEAQQALRSAEAFTDAVNRARVAINDARRRRGDWPNSAPGPAVAKLNRIDVLTDRDPLVRALQSWSPPR